MGYNLGGQEVVSSGKGLLSIKMILLYTFIQFAAVFGIPASQDARNVVQLVDGRNGKPIAGLHLVLFGGNSPEEVRLHKAKFDLVTSNDGFAAIPAFPPNIQWVQVWPDSYTLCQGEPNNNSFKVSDIAAVGVNTPNTCGKSRKETLPGHLVVFARPASWWEKMRW